MDQVVLTPQSSVFEIGCGDGFLTRTILKSPLERLWIFEIDEDWVNYVKNEIKDERMTVFHENVLDVDFKRLEPHAPWTLLANLPYQVTFPILHMLQRNIALFKEGVIMVQEEVAQKIVKTHGRGYGHPSLFFQHYFEWRILKQVPPQAFLPPPKVYSRCCILNRAFKSRKYRMKNNSGNSLKHALSNHVALSKTIWPKVTMI